MKKATTTRWETQKQKRNSGGVCRSVVGGGKLSSFIVSVVVITMCVRHVVVTSPYLAASFNAAYDELDDREDIGKPVAAAAASDEEKRGGTIRWNATDRSSKPVLYYCEKRNGNAYGEMKAVMASVLPEYEFRHLTARAVKNSKTTGNEHDVFITKVPDEEHPAKGPTAFRERYSGCAADWLSNVYRGKYVWFTGESPKFHPVGPRGNNNTGRQDDDNNGREHYFGIVTDENRRDGDFLLTYMQMVWWEKFATGLLSPAVMTDPALRPRGNSTGGGGGGRPPNFAIYANGNCIGYREIAVGLISEIGMVHCDGRCRGKTPPSGDRGNLTRTRHNIGIGNWWKNVELYSEYRFCFVMEHTDSHPSYVTEKIIMAFAGGCVPIYYGPELIFDIFNKEAFVFYNISSPRESLDKIRALENDEALYSRMMEQPIAANGNETIRKYFSFGDDRFGNGDDGTTTAATCKERMREILGVSGLTTV